MMNLRKTTFRLAVLSALSIVFLAVLVGVGINRIDSATERSARALERSQRNLELLHTVAQAHVGFSTQVHEWKNLLLRAAEPGAMDKYQGRFTREAGKVRELLKEAAQQMKRLGIDPKEADALMAAHADLTANYLAALDNFDPAKAGSAAAVDRIVRSRDRTTSEGFAAAAERLEESTRRRIKETLAESEAEAGSGRFALIVAGVIGILLALVITLWTAYELRTQLRNLSAEAG